jgi:glycosyltransferase involved in cell wall biosynthesis
VRMAMFSWRGPRNPLAGGAEVYTHHLLNSLATRGHEVAWFTSRDRHPKEIFASTPARYKLVQQGNRYSVYSAGRKWARRHATEFDLLIDQVNTIPFGLARLHLPVPVMGLFHQTAEDVWWDNTNILLALIGRFILEPRWLREFQSVPVAALSMSTQMALARHGIQQTKVLGVALDHEVDSVPEGISRDGNCVVVVSRLVKYKRVNHAIESVTMARKRHPELHLHIVGSGPAEKHLKRHSPSWVHWHGDLPAAERNAVVSRSAVNLACSRREGWGLTVTEASIRGVMTLGYPTPGLVDSITASRGVLCPENPAAMSEYLSDILDSRSWERYNAPSLGGVQSWNSIVDNFESFIGEFLDLNSLSRPGTPPTQSS